LSAVLRISQLSANECILYIYLYFVGWDRSL
jgi:hypothetical protein